MSDINETEPGPARSSEDRSRPQQDDNTKPIRAINDPERTVFSSKREPPRSSDSLPPSQPATRPNRRTVYQPPPPDPYAPPPYVSGPSPYYQAPPVQPAAGGRRWLGKSFLALSVFSVLLGALVLAAGAVAYFWIAAQLPPADELRSRSLNFATTQILDRDGNLLWEIIDPTGGRRTTVTLGQVSPYVQQATIATEDRFFYSNAGVDAVAILRALYYNVTEGEIVSGGSTISQQLARNVLLSPEERTEQTLSRKIKEAVLALEINRRYSKEQILEIYLNQIYYGNLAYGIEAAAQTYFNKTAGDLTLPEAAMLAGLPQAPALHDPYVNPDGATARQAVVLGLMVEAGAISQADAQAARMAVLQFHELGFAFRAPHFVTYVRQELETIVPPAFIYQAGLKVRTTLDPRLQAIAEEEVRTQVEALAGRNVGSGALVAMDVRTGQVLAMVGSKDFRDEAIDGQVNMAISPRQPGSSIKPLTYLATFEQLNWTPSTLIMDVPVEYPDGAGEVYRPRNYDDKFHGPVSLRRALANSYNIPAVKALAVLGIEPLKQMAARLGITTLTRNDYGLSLTLGSGEVSLLQMTGAYQAMANEGVLLPPTSILSITDSFGRVIQPPGTAPRRVLRAEHAYLMTHILADNEARSASVGPDSSLRLSRPAAAKTGTTNDFRDNWTMGYTPDIVTGVWVGNADRTPMVNVSGLAGAGPIWHNFMERAHEGLPVRDFTRPPAIVEMEVCTDSGTLPGPVCPERRREIFFQEQPPLGPEYDIHQMIKIDLNTGLRANEYCQANVEERYFRVYPPDGREWAISQGFEQPPEGSCPTSSIVATITAPLDGATVRGQLPLEGSAVAANFSHYQVEVGVGAAPQAFLMIHGPVRELVEQGQLGIFDTSQVENGPYTLRLVVVDRNGGTVEARVRILVDNPIATPTPTAPPSPTVTLSPPTVTQTPTAPLPTETPTTAPTDLPTDTPTETPTTTPTVIPTETPTLPIELPTETPTTEVQPQATDVSPALTPVVF